MKKLSVAGVALLILCLLGLIIRVIVASEKSIGFDEWLTITMSLGIVNPDSALRFNPPNPVTAGYFTQVLQHLPQQESWSFTNLLATLRKDLNLPLYFLIMSFWLRLGLPFSALVLRLPAIGFSIATIPFFVLLGKHFHRQSTGQSSVQNAGWIAAILFALTPFSIFYGTDARPYSLLMLLVTAGHWLSLSLKINGSEPCRKRDVILMILIVWAGLMTHYFFVFPALFWTISILLRHRPKQWKHFALLALTWLVPLAPMGILASQQLAYLHQSNPLKAPLTLATNAQFLYQGLFKVFFMFPPFQQGLPFFNLLFFVLAGWLAWRLVHQLWSNRNQTDETQLPRFCGWALLFTAGGLLLVNWQFQSRTLEVTRYWSIIAPALYLLVGYALRLGKPGLKSLKTMHALLAGLLLTSFLTQYLQMQGYADFDYRLVSREISRNPQPGDLTLTMAGYPTAVAISYYLPPETPVATIYTPWKKIDAQRLAYLTQNRRRIWFTGSFNQLPQPVYYQALDVLTQRAGFQQKAFLTTEPEPIALVLLERPATTSP